MPSSPVLLRRLGAVVPAAALAVLLLRTGAAIAADLPGSGGARVNGRLVSAERVWREYRFQGTVRGLIHSRPAGEIDEKLFASVVRQAISRELLEQEALRLGHRLTDADRAEARRQQVRAWKGEENFATAARMMGVPGEFLVDRAAAGLLREKMAAAAVPDKPPADEAQLRRYYDAHLADFLPAEPPPLRYIFIARKEGMRGQELFKQIATEADALRSAGKRFDAVIAKYSEHPGASAGGLAPDGAPGRPSQLKEGRFTNFVVDDDGLHMYLRDPRTPPPFETIRDKVRREELADRRRRWLAGTLERLTGEAKIEHLTGPAPAPDAGAAHGEGHKP